MKNKKSLLLSILFVSIISVSNTSAYAGNYRVDDAAIEAVFNNAIETVASDMPSVNDALSSNETLFADDKGKEEKTASVAILLNIFVGGLGIHRVYLGGSGVLVVGYILTCAGIFGVVPLIDLIVLIINNDDISKYVDNDKFFMW